MKVIVSILTFVILFAGSMIYRIKFGGRLEEQICAAAPAGTKLDGRFIAKLATIYGKRFILKTESARRPADVNGVLTGRGTMRSWNEYTPNSMSEMTGELEFTEGAMPTHICRIQFANGVVTESKKSAFD